MKSILVSKKKLPLLLHVLAWLIILVIPHYLIKTYGDGDNHFLYQFYSTTAIFGIIFYLNYLWLVPKFFFKENKWWYFLITSGVIVVSYLIVWYLSESAFHDPEREQQFQKIMEELQNGKERFKPPIKQFRAYSFFFTSILITGFSLGLVFFGKLFSKRTTAERPGERKAELGARFFEKPNQPPLLFQHVE